MQGFSAIGFKLLKPPFRNFHNEMILKVNQFGDSRHPEIGNSAKEKGKSNFHKAIYPFSGESQQKTFDPPNCQFLDKTPGSSFWIS